MLYRVQELHMRHDALWILWIFNLE